MYDCSDMSFQSLTRQKNIHKSVSTHTFSPSNTKATQTLRSLTLCVPVEWCHRDEPSQASQTGLDKRQTQEEHLVSETLLHLFETCKETVEPTLIAAGLVNEPQVVVVLVEVGSHLLWMGLFGLVNGNNTRRLIIFRRGTHGERTCCCFAPTPSGYRCQWECKYPPAIRRFFTVMVEPYARSASGEGRNATSHRYKTWK